MPLPHMRREIPVATASGEFTTREEDASQLVSLKEFSTAHNLYHKTHSGRNVVTGLIAFNITRSKFVPRKPTPYFCHFAGDVLPARGHVL